MEVDQGLDQDRVGLGRGRPGVEQVAGHENPVDALVAGDPDDLSEDLGELLRARPVADRPAEMPVEVCSRRIVTR